MVGLGSEEARFPLSIAACKELDILGSFRYCNTVSTPATAKHLSLPVSAMHALSCRLGVTQARAARLRSAQRCFSSRTSHAHSLKHLEIGHDWVLCPAAAQHCQRLAHVMFHVCVALLLTCPHNPCQMLCNLATRHSAVICCMAQQQEFLEVDTPEVFSPATAQPND